MFPNVLYEYRKSSLLQSILYVVSRSICSNANHRTYIIIDSSHKSVIDENECRFARRYFFSLLSSDKWFNFFLRATVANCLVSLDFSITLSSLAHFFWIRMFIFLQAVLFVLFVFSKTVDGKFLQIFSHSIYSCFRICYQFFRSEIDVSQAQSQVRWPIILLHSGIHNIWFFFFFSTADSLKIVGLWRSPSAIEEEAMNDNNDSINNINILGNHILQDKSQNQEFFHRIKTDKVVQQTKRKLSQDLSSAKKLCIKEEVIYDESNLHSLHALVKEEPINEPENVHLIQTTTINPNDILDTNSAPQVSASIRFSLYIYDSALDTGGKMLLACSRLM